MPNTYVVYSARMAEFDGAVVVNPYPHFIFVPGSNSALSLIRIDTSWRSLDSSLMYDDLRIGIEAHAGTYDPGSAAGGPYAAVALSDVYPLSDTAVYLDTSIGNTESDYICSFAHGDSLKTLDFADAGGWTVSAGGYLEIRMSAVRMRYFAMAFYFEETSP